MATTRPCGGADFGRLPNFYLGERFALQFGPGTPAVDWTDATAELTLDSPDGETRIELQLPSADGEIAGDGTYLQFLKTAAWAAENLNAAGDWEWHFWITPDGGDRDHQAWGYLPVVVAPGGGPA